jgi:hypothetical protein
MSLRNLFLLFICSTPLILIGCNRDPTPEFPQWHTPKAPYSPHPNSPNAFDDYALAAIETEATLPTMLHRTHFTPGMKLSILKKLEKPLDKIRLATTHKCDFVFQARQPFEGSKYHPGWRTLGRALCWNIEYSLYKSNPSQAIQDFLVATQFGFDLTEGDCLDASLGLTIIDNARKAFLPAIPSLSLEQMEQIAHKLIQIHHTRPSLRETLLHETENMFAAVQYLQDVYKQRRFEVLYEKLGPDCKPCITYLKRLANKNSQKSLAYFKDFAAEAKKISQNLLEDAEKPATQRQKKTEKKPQKPWQKFSKHFFGTASPFLILYDRTLARTRLLILHLMILKQVKSTHVAPQNLSPFPKEIIVDPFSGQSFIYNSVGIEYILYSIGENLQDDGGHTDETGTFPDLVLEQKFSH